MAPIDPDTPNLDAPAKPALNQPAPKPANGKTGKTGKAKTARKPRKRQR